MWLLLAFLSATLLGFYDVFKKQSLKDNAVLPVLFLNTLFSSLIFLPFILVSAFEPDLLGGTIFNVPVAGWEQHKYIIIKSFIVLSSWIFGYFGMKHLPITIVGPINATRPVMVLVGAMLVFGERLNLYQWIGVMLAVAIGITMIAVVVMAKTIGCVLPLAAKKIGLDPAIMAAPLITTILDTCTILVYFRIVTAFFHI